MGGRLINSLDIAIYNIKKLSFAVCKVMMVFAVAHSLECCRFNEFGNDGGSAAKTLVPKFSVFSKHVTAHTGFQIKILVAGAIALKGIGSLLFIFGSTIGAFLLLIATPILYDFYNYDVEKKEFSQLFIKFTQVMMVFAIVHPLECCRSCLDVAGEIEVRLNT
ncbi:HR-like lesion-inducer [Cynara cardunculus var. scolymus]|uniref:HR-like lesion-inducer n=1 Tax=Cynara cardunculus var. scolymus TaxID=59895 RepID=A0A103Y3H9_CYNCS|nr:HR-like lesion-inducer [Cynara cardunculus var. scolymus]